MRKKSVLSEREETIVRLARAGEWQELIEWLNRGTHHGKPGASMAEKMLATEAMRAAGDRQVLTERAFVLAAMHSPMAKQIACALLQELWPDDLSLTDLVLALTTDDDWEVREWAAPAYTALLASEWPRHLPVIEELTMHPHESVKRQIALAIKQTAQKRIAGSVDSLLALTERLLPEEHEYVRKNLGPFCIGDGLLRVYPQETLSKLKRWATDEPWPVRWNAVMSFGGASGSAHPDVAYEILSGRIDDPHPLVQKAVKRAIKNLAKRCPDDDRLVSLAKV